ncbi:ATP-grasp domain-containing protein [Mordavella massiliensis]|uniref:ATP-grasp domain-containing protein n=1 Tax=Mordavella massiliensis TaxID=1871024 RepID=UPI002108ACE9|nr:ATP-grasp domain-containing protein [Mordavella massiliensis]
MKPLDGKKLLILGACANQISLIKRAKELGVYVVVTDYYKDRKISPAKDYADEAWDVSWSDIDRMVELCVQNSIDGITTGYSEIRVDSLIDLCSKLKLPCYITREQFEITKNKEKFKQECRKCGVPVVKEYNNITDVAQFPVIVKPVDRGGSIGISVANTPEELHKAYQYAMEMSLSKRVIIEDFITDSMKIDAYYLIKDGEPILAGTSDTINSNMNGTERVIQNGWIFPSRMHDIFVTKIDESLKLMIKDMNIKTGYIFFSGFVNPEGEFAFFECGFRLSGGHNYTYLSQKGFVNPLDLFIYQALCGDEGLPDLGEDRVPELKCLIINFYAKAGKIKKIIGFDRVRTFKDCVSSIVFAYEGQECISEKAILTKVGMINLCNVLADQLETELQKIYNTISIIDVNNTDMIYDRIDCNLIGSWWT